MSLSKEEKKAAKLQHKKEIIQVKADNLLKSAKEDAQQELLTQVKQMQNDLNASLKDLLAQNKEVISLLTSLKERFV